MLSSCTSSGFGVIRDLQEVSVKEQSRHGKKGEVEAQRVRVGPAGSLGVIEQALVLTSVAA